MNDGKFSFKKTVGRNDFTLIFGRVGKRRTVFFDKGRKPNHYKRTRMQKYRRAAQGWRNQTYGRLVALKMLIKYGKQQPTRRFGINK
jgi:Holliday junction resolvase RusA-like endonuclease